MTTATAFARNSTAARTGLPTFLIIGAAKAGTTAVHGYLRQHPDIYLTPLKETNFFAYEGRPPRCTGPQDDRYVNAFSLTTREQYAAQFAGARDERAHGEASPLYLYDPGVPERIRRRVPDVRLIALLRQPADRAYSAYLHTRRDGREPLEDFSAALAAEPQRIAAGWEHLWHYRAMGCYAEQLARYRRVFDPDRLAVFLYDDLLADPSRVLAACMALLGVDATFRPDLSERPNRADSLGPVPAALHPHVRDELTKEFAPDIARLEVLLDRDLSAWLRTTPPA